MKNKDLTENSLLEYLLIYVYWILFCIMLSGIYLRRNMLVTHGKESSQYIIYVYNDFMCCWAKCKGNKIRGKRRKGA
jgi:hypothetical protein